MVIVGLNVTKIEAERKTAAKGQVKINNNVSIDKVEEQKLNLGKTSQYGLKFDFSFSTVYEPGIGQIRFTGNVMTIEDEKKGKEILDDWKKTKKIPTEVMTPILNNVLRKCNIQAMILSQEINLPPPIPIPKIQPGPAPKGK